MNSNFSYNLLKHLRRKQAEGGFTLIELLVVIIIIGILAAIALPSFLNQANRARETEAVNNLGAAGRGQQAYYLEFVEFAPTVAALDVGVETSSENYLLTDATNGTTEGKFTVDAFNGLLYAVPQKNLTGFASAAYIYTANDKNNTGFILCGEKKTDAKNATLDNDLTKATATAEATCGTNLVEK
jgi:prepilin-type N-terminal cleavage/methylation domain-containing protein